MAETVKREVIGRGREGREKGGGGEEGERSGK